MKTTRLQTDDDPSVLASVTLDIAHVLCSGGVALVPTDTVYGLACLPTDAAAVQATYAMKRRPADRRLPIIVADLPQARASLPLEWSHDARALAAAFWPGALTIACAVRESRLEWLRGRAEAATRASAHPLIESIARRLGPFLMTSANQHGIQTPTSFDQALAALASPPEIAVDGGVLSGTSSTLVNTNLPRPAIEREGAIAAEAIWNVLRGG